MTPSILKVSLLMA